MTDQSDDRPILRTSTDLAGFKIKQGYDIFEVNGHDLLQEAVIIHRILISLSFQRGLQAGDIAAFLVSLVAYQLGHLVSETQHDTQLEEMKAIFESEFKQAFAIRLDTMARAFSESGAAN